MVSVIIDYVVVFTKEKPLREKRDGGSIWLGKRVPEKSRLWSERWTAMEKMMKIN